MAGEADAAADGDGPTEAAGDAAGFATADGEAAGDGEATGFAAGEMAGATVAGAAGALVGVEGAPEVQLARITTVPVRNANRHEDGTKAVTSAFYAATCWRRSASLSRQEKLVALVPLAALPARLRTFCFSFIEFAIA